MKELATYGKLEKYASYLVDTNHIGGLQIHTVLRSGVVIVGSYRFKTFITAYLLRPYQLNRYGIYDKELYSEIVKNNEKRKY